MNMKINFGMNEILVILGVAIYNQNSIICYTLLSLGILGSISSYLIKLSEINSKEDLLKKRLIMSDREREFVINKMSELKVMDEDFYDDYG